MKSKLRNEIMAVVSAGLAGLFMMTLPPMWPLVFIWAALSISFLLDAFTVK
jgi:hypothetical protein